MKNNKGFTIVEVIVSVALLGIVVLIVAKLMSYQNLVNTQATQMQNNLYNAQKNIEQKTIALKDIIEKKQIPDESIYGTADLSYKIFGKTVDCYAVSADVKNSDDSVAFKLDTAVPKEDIKFTPPIPTIKNAKLTMNGDTDKYEAFYYNFANGFATAKASAEKDANPSEFQKNLYQWFLTDTRYHVIPSYDGDYKNGKYRIYDILYEKEYPRLPTDFGMLSGFKDETFKIRGEDVGKVLACSITAGGKHGYMGNTLATNYVYISNLPKLEQGAYKTIIDPSVNFETFKKYLSSNKVLVSENPEDALKFVYPSTNPSAEPTSDNMLDFDVNGASTKINYGNKDFKTNYISFDANKTIETKVKNTTDNNFTENSIMYFVGKIDKTQYTSNKNFIEIKPRGLYKDFNSGTGTDNIVDNKWGIYSFDFAELAQGNDYKKNKPLNKIVINTAGLEFAEFILVNNPNDNDKTAINDYLMEKYKYILAEQTAPQ